MRSNLSNNDVTFGYMGFELRVKILEAGGVSRKARKLFEPEKVNFNSKLIE